MGSVTGLIIESNDTSSAKAIRLAAAKDGFAWPDSYCESTDCDTDASPANCSCVSPRSSRNSLIRNRSIEINNTSLAIDESIWNPLILNSSMEAG